MNIGILTELFPPSMGGQEQRFAALADLLVERGHRVTVLCVGFPADAPAEEVLHNGVTVIRAPAAPRYSKPLGGLLPRSPLAMVRYALAARRLTRAKQFDALLLNQWPLLHILALDRRNRNRSIVDWCEVRSGWLFDQVQRVLPKLVAANIAVSKHVAEQMRQRSGTNLMVLPSGVESDSYQAEPAERRSGLLSFGRITGHKNLELTISTFEELCRRGFDEGLTIAGGGPDQAALQDRIARSPVRDRIEMLGRVSDTRKAELLGHAKLLLITSRREGFPRAVAEAMASGLPVVTARFPQNGTVAVVEEFGCGLCTEPDPIELADAVKAVLADWPTWSDRCITAAPQLDWSNLIQRLEVLLSRTAAGADGKIPGFAKQLKESV